MKDILMSDKEADRFHILSQVSEGKLSIGRAAELLDISTRQTIRINNRFTELGKEGLVSRKRNRSSNRKFSNKFKKNTLEIIVEHYRDFGPTLIEEMLLEKHSIRISHETIRKWLIEEKIWTLKCAKGILHPHRERKECYGEMVQSDASDHYCFGENEPPCHLHLFIDDATSSIPCGYFAPEELTAAYFQLSRIYFRQEGLPRSLYVDPRGVFKVNSGKDPYALTQFGRAMQDLGIQMIFARSPQGKGRVERSFETHQDRLVKLLRIEGIHNSKEGNEYLPYYFKKHNLKFAKTPKSTFNAHRPLPPNIDLSHILCEKETRVVSNDLQVSFNGTLYQMIDHKAPNRLKRAEINVITTLEGIIKFEYKGEFLMHKTWKGMPYQHKK